MKHARGFTIIELLVVIVALGAATILFVSQKAQLDATQRDTQRKVAINAMYYTLEEVYYQQHKSYPASIDSKTLRAVDPSLFTDPTGVKLGDASSSYRYEPKDCLDGKCKGYSLRADLEREDDFIKQSRNK